MVNEIMAPTDKGNCPCCDAAADTFVLECEKCKKWIHFACSKLPPYMLIQFGKSTRAYSCSTCVHERFMMDFPALHDTYEEAIIKQNITLRTDVTADFSSQTDPLSPADEPEPTHTDSLPPTQSVQTKVDTDQQSNQANGLPPTQPATTDLTKDVTEQLTNEQQADDNSLPLHPIPPPPNSVLLGIREVNSKEPRVTQTPQDGDSASNHKTQELTTDGPPKTPSCKFYLQGRCRHGRIGKDCRYVHPPMCHKFIKDGEKSCKKGSDCKYVHPKLCIRSLNTKECLKVTCSFYHVAGTRRNSDDKQTPQKLMSINTGMPVNQHIPAFSHPANLPHPSAQPTSSNAPNSNPSSNPPPNSSSPHLPPPGYKPPPSHPNISTYHSPMNHPPVPSGLPSVPAQTNHHNAVPITPVPNNDSSIFLGQLRDIKLQMSQMMETQNYLLKVVMKQEWPSLPKHSHIY